MTTLEETISELRTVTEKIQAARADLTKLSKEERRIKGLLLKTVKSTAEPGAVAADKPAEKQASKPKKPKAKESIPKITFD
jgi:hypothetical protein